MSNLSKQTESHICWACQAVYDGDRGSGKCPRCENGGHEALTSKERTLLLESTGESRDADYEVVLRFNRAVTEAEYRAIHEHVKRLTGQSAPVETEARLTDTACNAIIADLEAREWTGLTRDDIRMFDELIKARRGTQETSAPCECRKDQSGNILTYRMSCPVHGTQKTADDLQRLRTIVGDIHEITGEDRNSDDDSLPDRVRRLLSDLRGEIQSVEEKTERGCPGDGCRGCQYCRVASNSPPEKASGPRLGDPHPPSCACWECNK